MSTERRIVNHPTRVYTAPWRWTSQVISGRIDHASTLQERCSLYSQLYAPLLVLLLVAFVTYVFFVYLMRPLFLGPSLTASCSPDWLLPASIGYVVAVVAVLYYVVVGALFLASWTRTLLTDPGAVPASYMPQTGADPTTNNTATTTHNAATNNTTPHRRRVGCRRCGGAKPPRTHHCSVVDRCVLRFDHYCPWVFAAVGHFNYKYYVLTLLYATLLSGVLCVSTLARFLVTGLHLGQQCALELSLCGAALCVALLFWNMVGGLLGSHLRYVALNLTTVEWMQELGQFQNLGLRGCERFRITTHRWYLGTERRNWEQVFGVQPLLWFLPVASRRRSLLRRAVARRADLGQLCEWWRWRWN